MACIYPKGDSVLFARKSFAPPERGDGHLRTMEVAVLRIWCVLFAMVMVPDPMGPPVPPPP
jgi:hypothetical protein